MIRQTVAQAIVLSRTNYQEADRILTLLTPNNGKLRLVAKGVRKSKSKMAGGIELFSVSEVGYIQGKGELGTLTSSRLTKHYENIVQDVERTMLGYELIKILNRTTEDGPESDYFELLTQAFEALDDPALNLDIVKMWFYGQLLRIAGHTPTLASDSSGKPLLPAESYGFDYDNMVFLPKSEGPYSPNHIKFLRLVIANNQPRVLAKVQNAAELTPPSLGLLETLLHSHVRT